MIAASEGIQFDGWALVGALVLLVLNGFFVASEFALLAARRSRIEQLAADGDKRAAHALAGIRELTLMLAGAQLGITMCSLGLGALAEPALAGLIESVLGEVFTLSDTARHVIGFAFGLSIVVFLHMVVGEMAPKSWAISHPEDSSLKLARSFRLFVTIFRPVIRFLNWLGNLVVRSVGVEPKDERAMTHSPADLILLLDESAGHGGIEMGEHELLTRTLELSGLTAEDAMTVRRDIVAVSADASAAEAAAVAHRTGRTRVVVHEGDLDHVRGFVHAKDLLRLPEGTWATTESGDLTRSVMVTHEHHRVEDLLVEMRTERHHISLVVDEHGTVVGLVTMEDLIEELIGDFHDESDLGHGDCELVGERTYRMSGTLRPDEFEERVGLTIPEGDWQTVAGYVIGVLDEIPSAGDVVSTPVGEFSVLAMDGYAIDRLQVVLAPPTDPSGEAPTGKSTDRSSDPSDGQSPG
jgi:CBS domain containing-hemolysin-like protein